MKAEEQRVDTRTPALSRDIQPPMHIITEKEKAAYTALM